VLPAALPVVTSVGLDSHIQSTFYL